MGRLLQGGLLYTPRGLQAQVQPPSHGQARQHSSWHFLLSLNPKSRSRLAQEKALNDELYRLLESGKQICPPQPFCTFIQWRLFSRVWWPSLVANGQGMTKIWAVKARGFSHVR